LGISTAPQLIRRKAGFGTEVIEHATDLALVLVSLQDRYKLPKFQELRIQSLVALIVAYPLTMGKWAAHTLFNADLSQSQRSSLLVAIGLSARELAGLKDEDAKVLGLPAKESETSFPSKRLPENLEDVYNATPRSIESLSKNISKMTLQPLALNAVDAATGPNALKIRTFSSRMEVEKGRQQREKKRKEKVSKDLHKILSDGLFSPLINEFALMMHSMS
jgi:telomere length regulation protein